MKFRYFRRIGAAIPSQYVQGLESYILQGHWTHIWNSALGEWFVVDGSERLDPMKAFGALYEVTEIDRGEWLARVGPRGKLEEFEDRWQRLWWIPWISFCSWIPLPARIARPVGAWLDWQHRRTAAEAESRLQTKGVFWRPPEEGPVSLGAMEDPDDRA